MGAKRRKGTEMEAADRISSLPRDLKAYVLAFLPIGDAAKTSILSKTWRHIWTEIPGVVINLLLSDHKILNHTNAGYREYYMLYYINIVNRILLQSRLPILDFVLVVPALFPSIEFFNIDMWILFLLRHDLEGLSLYNLSPNAYRIPSCVFSCPTLEILNISNCIFEAPTTNETFYMLTELTLKKITFHPVVLGIPNLASLSIQQCKGTRYFKIFVPKLLDLVFIDNDDLELSYFSNCTNMVCAKIELSNGLVWKGQNERMTLTKLLSNWPSLKSLVLDASFLKCIFAGCSTVPGELPTALNGLEHLVVCRVSYGLQEVALIVSLIQEFPKLCILEIWTAEKLIDTDMKVIELLEEPSVLKQSISGLETVEMGYFRGSRAELSFAKLLLANCPSMRTMYISEKPNIDVTTGLQTSTALLRFSRASPKAEIIFEERTRK